MSSSPSSSVYVASLEKAEVGLPSSIGKDRLDKLTIPDCTAEMMRKITSRFDCPHFTVLAPSKTIMTPYITLETYPIGTTAFWIRDMAKSARNEAFIALRYGDFLWFRFVMRTFELSFTHEHVAALANAAHLSVGRRVAHVCDYFPAVVYRPSHASSPNFTVPCHTAAEILCHAAFVGDEKVVEAAIKYCSSEKLATEPRLIYGPHLARAVYNASARGHASIVERLLSDSYWSHVTLAYKFRELKGALKIASYNGHADVVKALVLEIGHSKAALKAAIICNHIEIVSWLLDKVLSRGLPHALNALHLSKAALIAAGLGHTNLVGLLLSVFPNVNTAYNALQLLSAAAAHGQLEVVQLIYGQFAPVLECRDAVELAVAHGHVDVASFLLPLAYDELYATPDDLIAMYHQSIERNNVALVKLLLGLFPCSLNDGLKHACAHGGIEVVTYLNERGAEVTAGCITRCLNSFKRSRAQTDEMVSYLVGQAPLGILKNKAFELRGNHPKGRFATLVKTRDTIYTAFDLRYECDKERRNLESIKAQLLVNDKVYRAAPGYVVVGSNKCSVNLGAHEDGRAILSAAVRRNRLFLVKLLIAHGADLIAHGDHVLGLAVRMGHYDIVKCIIKEGVQPHAIRTKRGHSKTIRDAIKHDRLQVLELLLSIACGSERAQRRFDAFILACKYGKLDAVQHIISDDLASPEALSSTKQCIICAKAPKEVVLPCGHYDMCVACARKIPSCAICRLPYQPPDIIKVIES